MVALSLRSVSTVGLELSISRTVSYVNESYCPRERRDEVVGMGLLSGGAMKRNGKARGILRQVSVVTA